MTSFVLFQLLKCVSLQDFERVICQLITKLLGFTFGPQPLTAGYDARASKTQDQ